MAVTQDAEFEIQDDWYPATQHKREATRSVDAIFDHHGDRCLDKTRASLVEAFAEEAEIRDILAEELTEEQLKCRNWFWLWACTTVLLGCAVATLWMGITL